MSNLTHKGPNTPILQFNFRDKKILFSLGRWADGAGVNRTIVLTGQARKTQEIRGK